MSNSTSIIYLFFKASSKHVRICQTLQASYTYSWKQASSISGYFHFQFYYNIIHCIHFGNASILLLHIYVFGWYRWCLFSLQCFLHGCLSFGHCVVCLSLSWVLLLFVFFDCFLHCCLSFGHYFVCLSLSLYLLLFVSPGRWHLVSVVFLKMLYRLWGCHLWESMIHWQLLFRKKNLPMRAPQPTTIGTKLATKMSIRNVLYRFLCSLTSCT